MKNDKNHRGIGHDHNQDFRDVKRPILSGNIVQYHIGKRSICVSVWNTLVYHREGSRRQYEVYNHKEKCCNRKQRLTYIPLFECSYRVIFFFRTLLLPRILPQENNRGINSTLSCNNRIVIDLRNGTLLLCVFCE